MSDTQEIETKEEVAVEDKDKIIFKKEGKSSSGKSLAAAGIVILVGASVLAYKSGVDVKKLRSDVAGFSSDLTARYAEQGYDITFNHGKIGAEGGILSQEITIDAPELSIGKGELAYTLTSPNMTVVPEDKQFSAFAATLASPVTINRAGGQHVYTYTTKTPVELRITTNKNGEREYHLPLQAKSTLQVSDNGSDAKDYVLNVAPDSVVHGSFVEKDFSNYTLNIALNKAALEHDGKNTTFAHGSYGLEKDAEGEAESIHLENAVSDLVPAQLTPLSLDLAQKVTTDEVKGSVLFDIEQFIITNEHYDADIEGNFTMLKEQVLPYADVKVTLNNADYVLDALSDSKIVDGGITRVIGSSLRKIAPDWTDGSQAPLDFKIHRADNDPFMVGSMKADELFAGAIKEWYVNSKLPVQSEAMGEAEVTEEVVEQPLVNDVADVVPDADEVQAEVTQAVDDAADIVSDTTDAVIDSVADTVDDAVEATKETTDAIVEESKGFFDKATDMAKDAGGAVADAVSDGVDAAADMSDSVVDAAKNAGSAVGSAVSDGIDAAADVSGSVVDAGSAAGGVISEGVDAAKNAVEATTDAVIEAPDVVTPDVPEVTVPEVDTPDVTAPDVSEAVDATVPTEGSVIDSASDIIESSKKTVEGALTGATDVIKDTATQANPFKAPDAQ